MKNKVIILLVSVLTFTACQAQESNLLVNKKLISNFSKTPIYSRLTENIDGTIQWKEKFKYIDSIEVYGITYLSDGLKIKGLLVKPKKKGNYPCVIYNRGGNRGFGALKIANGVITLGQIAKEGYVVIASQYRGNGGSEGQEEFGGKDVNDVVILTEVLMEIDGADTNNIGMYGWSRGGMMTYMALTKTNKVKAAVVGGGVSDLTVMDRPEFEAGVYEPLIPNYKDNKNKELEKRSAVKWVDQFPKNTPILLLHGNADWRVKASNSLKLALEFEKYRIPYRLKIFEGGDHGLSEYKQEVNQDVINWFDKYLKQDAELPNMEYHGK